MTRRFGITACSKSKRGEGTDETFPARDLYDSWLFDGRVDALENHCDEWAIFSAEHGYVAPDDELSYYDREISELPEDERRELAREVVQEIPDDVEEVMVLMGRDYFEPLVAELPDEIDVWDPLEGIQLFDQRAALGYLAEEDLKYTSKSLGLLAYDYAEPCPNCAGVLFEWQDECDHCDVDEETSTEQQTLIPDGGQVEGGIDRSSLSMAEFNDLLNTEVEKANPTTHAPIIRDDNDLLIYAHRSRNTDSEWEIRAYEVVGHEVSFRLEDKDRASMAAIFLELFDGDDLTTDEPNRTRAVYHGIPVAVAVDGKPAIAAFLFMRHQLDREEIAEEMGVGDATVDEYLSRFRRRGTGIPDHVDAPKVGDVMPEVPSPFDPGHQQIVADGGTDLSQFGVDTPEPEIKPTDDLDTTDDYKYSRPQCRAVTGGGSRCSNPVRRADGDVQFCPTHYEMDDVETVDDTSVEVTDS